MWLEDYIRQEFPEEFERMSDIFPNKLAWVGDDREIHGPGFLVVREDRDTDKLIIVAVDENKRQRKIGEIPERHVEVTVRRIYERRRIGDGKAIVFDREAERIQDIESWISSMEQSGINQIATIASKPIVE
jgi:hypothetical protein